MLFLQVIATKCDSLFSIEYTSDKNDVTIFTNNMTIVNTGYFEKYSRNNVIVQNAKILSVKDVGPCSLKFPISKEFGHPYKLNLDTMHREPISLLKGDICEEINSFEEIEDAILRYFEILLSQTVIDEPTLIDMENSVKFLNNVKKIGDTLYEAEMKLFDEVHIQFFYFGTYNENGNFHGYAMLQLTNTPLTFCLRGRCTKEHNYDVITGVFSNGVLHGPTSIILNNGTQIMNLLLNNGITHGLVITTNTTSSPLYQV